MYAIVLWWGEAVRAGIEVEKGSTLGWVLIILEGRQAFNLRKIMCTQSITDFKGTLSEYSENPKEWEQSRRKENENNCLLDADTSKNIIHTRQIRFSRSRSINHGSAATDTHHVSPTSTCQSADSPPSGERQGLEGRASEARSRPGSFLPLGSEFGVDNAPPSSPINHRQEN
ncbi:hypothetical protein GWI33_016854 [Rhynchophorus ferrugineus]|uniref:Uncharacterized protein n=1 Tax=Rhynchophorus ferrugineus TaxID=354439 RepID=A0A834M9W1_RHYFE|nr:hypothetical protein GWI33_016854 [Rhynchophorus ferrugineus]